jgi:hypothetical protein
LEEGKAPKDLLENKNKVLALKAAPSTIINGYIYKMRHDDVLRICSLEHEKEDIINEAHAGPTGGNFRSTRQRERYFRRVCGGQLYINIVRNNLINVIVVGSTFVEVKLHYNQSILIDHFRSFPSTLLVHFLKEKTEQAQNILAPQLNM